MNTEIDNYISEYRNMNVIFNEFDIDFFIQQKARHLIPDKENIIHTLLKNKLIYKYNDNVSIHFIVRKNNCITFVEYLEQFL